MRMEHLFQYRGKQVALPSDRISENTRSVFLTGHCHSLALAIHQKTGWPMVGIVAQQSGNPRKSLDAMFDEPLDMRAVGRRWVHMGVLSPEGDFVDIDGASSQEEALGKHVPKKWDASKGPYAKIIHMTPSQVADLYYCSGGGFMSRCLKPNPEAAMPFAELVLNGLKGK
jgi:hypothetical protein